jgi:hypothetical protein
VKIVITAFLLMAISMLGMMYFSDQNYHFHKYYIHKHPMKVTDDMELNKHILTEHVLKN